MTSTIRSRSITGIMIFMVAIFASTDALALTPPRNTLPSDINGNEWFVSPLRDMIDAGYIPWQEPFRAADVATRGEFVRLLFSKDVRDLEKGTMTFNDVPSQHPAYAAVEHAATKGVLKGAGDCRGTHPCFVYPDSPMTRAEAAAIVVRAFALHQSEKKLPTYSDIERGSWYESSIYAAVAHCILHGDDGSTTMRPSANMNRAEMLMIATRSMNLRSFPTCGEQKPRMSSSSAAVALPQETLDSLQSRDILWSAEKGSNSLQIPIDELISESLFAFTYEAPAHSLRLTTPEGVIISQENAPQYAIPTESSDYFTAFKVAKPSVGIWKMDMDTSGKSGLSLLMKSPLQLEINPTEIKTVRTAGQPVIIRAHMSDYNLVSNTNIIVRIGHNSLEGNLGVQMMDETAPEPWNPAAAGGPYYETTFTPSAAGTYCFSAVAYGTTNQGTAFLRLSPGWCDVVQ